MNEIQKPVFNTHHHMKYLILDVLHLFSESVLESDYIIPLFPRKGSWADQS